MNASISKTNSPALEQLLQRGDIWRGHSQRFTAHPGVDTGYEALNQRLLNSGWPTGSLIEICRASAGCGDWLLFLPILKTQLAQTGKLAVLLNPPALPFAQGLLQAKLALQQLIVVCAASKADFITSFVELARSPCCAVLLAWQPKQALSYTELRKCQLACSDGAGIYTLFRPLQAQQQSSPAALRVLASLNEQTLQLNLLKQRGQLQNRADQALQLHLPEHWKAQAPHRKLGGETAQPPVAANDRTFTHYQPRQNILSLGLRLNAGKKVRLKRRYY